MLAIREPNSELLDIELPEPESDCRRMLDTSYAEV